MTFDASETEVAPPRSWSQRDLEAQQRDDALVTALLAKRGDNTGHVVYEQSSPIFTGPAPERFVVLTGGVSVLASEVAAVTSDGPDRSRVYLRGTGARGYLVVDVPMSEVINLLERGASPPEHP